MTAKRVVLWDPNSVNPYSGEIAAILIGGRYEVSRWVSKHSVSSSTVPGCTDVRILAANRSAEGIASHSLRRIIAPLLFAFSAILTRRIVVLCWVRGSYESILFATLLPLARGCVLVDHNPVPDRESSSPFSSVARFLRRSVSVRVVHRRQFVEEGPANAVYIAHPRYAIWTQQLRASVTPASALDQSRLDGSRVRALLLGALRADKGWANMHTMFESIDPGSVEFVIVGVGQIPPDCARIISERSIEVHAHLSDVPLDDNAVVEALNSSDVLIAPYVNATASGTVMLAFSWGLPTLAFSSGELSEILCDRALVETNDFVGIAHLIEEWRLSRFSTYSLSADVLDREVRNRWLDVVAFR